MEQNSVIDQQIPLNPSDNEKRFIRKQYNKAGCMALIMTFGFQIIAYIIMIIYNTVMVQRGLTTHQINEKLSGMTLDFVLINLISYAVAYPIILLLFKAVSGDKIPIFFSTKNLHAKSVIKYVVIAFTFLYGGSIIGNLLNMIASMNGYQLSVVDTTQISGGWLSNLLFIVLICIAAPVLEEIVFRGYIMKAFSGVSPRFAIVMSSVLFSMTHGNFIQAIGVFFLALFLGYVTYKTGSIIAAIIIHCVCNTYGTISGMLLSKFSELYGVEKGTLIVGGAMAIIMLTLIASGIVLLALNKKHYSLPKDNEVQKQRTFKIEFTSWPLYVSIAFFLLLSIISIRPVVV